MMRVLFFHIAPLLLLVLTANAQNARMGSPAAKITKYGGTDPNTVNEPPTTGLPPTTEAPLTTGLPPTTEAPLTTELPPTKKVPLTQGGHLCHPCETKADCRTKLCAKKMCVNRRKQVLTCKRKANNKVKWPKKWKCAKCNPSKPCKRGKCLKGKCAPSLRTRRLCNRRNRRKKRVRGDRKVTKRGNAEKCETCSVNRECQSGLRCLRQRCALGWWNRWGCGGKKQKPNQNEKKPVSYRQANDDVSNEMEENEEDVSVAERREGSEYVERADTANKNGEDESEDVNGSGKDEEDDITLKEECAECSRGFECASGQCIQSKCVIGKQYEKCFDNVRSSSRMERDPEIKQGDVVVEDLEDDDNMEDDIDLSQVVDIDFTSGGEQQEFGYDGDGEDEEAEDDFLD